MADHTWGYNKTFPGPQEAHDDAGTADGDTITAYPTDADGTEMSAGSMTLAITKAVTFRSNDIKRKAKITGAITIAAAAVVQDFELWNTGSGFQPTTGGTNCIISRCAVIGGTFGLLATVPYKAYNNFFLRCLYGCWQNAGGVGTIINNLFLVNYTGIINNGGSHSAYNNIFLDSHIRTDAYGSNAAATAGSNNQTWEAAVGNLPGDTEVSKGHAATKTAKFYSPSGGSYNPEFYGNLDGLGSSAENTGAVTANTDSYFGVARDGSTPNRGPCEGFTGFAAAPVDPSSQSSASLSSISSQSLSSYSTQSSQSLSSLSTMTSQSQSSVSSMTSASLSSESSRSSQSLSSYSSATSNSSSSSSGAGPVFPSEPGVLASEGPYGPNGNDYLGTLDITAPVAPTITAHEVANGQVTITVNNASATVTNELWWRVVGGTWAMGGTPIVGDGDIIKAGLTNGTTYEIEARSKNASGIYGPASDSIFVIVNSSAEVTGSQLSAYMSGIRDHYLTNANFAAWINSVDPTGTTAGNTILGYSPKDMPDVTTAGPVALIRWANLSAPNAGSAKAFRGTIDIIVDHVYAIGTHARASHTGISEATYFSRIITEMIQDIGITLEPTYGGTVINIQSGEAWAEDQADARIWHREITYTVEFGLRDDAT